MSPRRILITSKRTVQTVDFRHQLPQHVVVGIDAMADVVEAKMQRIEALADALEVGGRLDARRLTREYGREMVGFPLQSLREGLQGAGGPTPDTGVVPDLADRRGGDPGSAVQLQLLDAEVDEARVDRTGHRVPILSHRHSPLVCAGADANRAGQATEDTRRNPVSHQPEIAGIVIQSDEIVIGGGE